jgi:integrase
MQQHSILRDQEARRFHARRQFGPDVTFGVFYRNAEGLQRWHKIGRFGTWTVAQARKEAQRVLRARDLGEDPSAQRMALRSAPTVAELCDEYVAEMENGTSGKKTSTIRTDVGRINGHIKPALGKRKVTGIGREDVESFVRGMSVGSQRRILGLLGAIFAFGVKRKLRVDNPAHGIERPAEVRRTRRLADSEYAQLWGALENGKGVANEVIWLLAVTGWRSGEAKNLRWSEVCFGVQN